MTETNLNPGPSQQERKIQQAIGQLMSRINEKTRMRDRLERDLDLLWRSHKELQDKIDKRTGVGEVVKL